MSYYKEAANNNKNGYTCSGSSNIIEGSPSFFKVIRYPSSPHLVLPNAFVRSYLEKIPKNPTLKTATGGHSWKLKFVKIGEDYCFAHGWDKLAKDVHLCIRDIVVFWLIDPFTFQVSFLDANGCCKDLPLNNKTNNNDKNVDDDDDDDDDLCFEKVISRKTHKYYMLLPVNFVKAAGLEYTSSVKVKDHLGKEWSMGIVVESYNRTKYNLSTPWCQFRRFHQLSDGDVCYFKFDKKEGVLNLTKVVRNNIPPPQHGIGSAIKDACSPIKKPCDAGGVSGVKVKIEFESGDELDVANRKRRALDKPVSGAKVKIEDGSGSVEAVNRKMGRFAVDKPCSDGGVKVKTGQETEKLHICKRVVYF